MFSMLIRCWHAHESLSTRWTFYISIVSLFDAEPAYWRMTIIPPNPVEDVKRDVLGHAERVLAIELFAMTLAWG